MHPPPPQKAVRKLMVQNFQLTADPHQKTTQSPTSSCTLPCKLSRLNYMEVHRPLDPEGPTALDFQ